METWYGGPRLSINHENATRQYSENGLSSYYGAMKSIPTAAIEALLNLTPLDVLIMVEARMTLYILHISKQPTDLKTEVGMLSIWKIVGDPILDMRSDHTTPIYDYSKTFKVIIDQDY
jgi:hypothetical protein